MNGKRFILSVRITERERERDRRIMDFSKLIGKEIQKKKDSQNGRRRALGRREKKISKVDDVKGGANGDDDEKVLQSNVGGNAGESEIAGGGSQPVGEAVIENDNSAPAIPYTEEEITLSQNLSDSEIDSKLSTFNELSNEPNISKLSKIRKLGILLRKQQKDLVYQSQLDRESKVEMDLNVKEMGLPEFEEKIYLQLRKYIKYLVKCWETTETDTKGLLLLETKRDLIKLLYKLRKQNLKHSIFASLTTTIYYLQIQDFPKANEAYLKLSIGNAAWPIGVRSVGIHQRSADLKITGDNKSHSANIMIDDKTRRWITGIKRLISFCERTAKRQ